MKPFWLLLFLPSLFISAKERTDTLRFGESSVVITYDLKNKGDDVIVEFKSVEKRNFNDFGCQPNELAVLFFNNAINTGDKEFRGIDPQKREAIKVPSNAEYDVSRGDEGYVRLDDDMKDVTLTFQMKNDYRSVLIIPVYLAQYVEKKGIWPFKNSETYYNIRADWYCGNLQIPLKKRIQTINDISTDSRFVTETISETQEIENPSNQNIIDSLKSIMPSPGPTPEEQEQMEQKKLQDKARRLIDDIKRELPTQEKLPLSSNLMQNISTLQGIQSDINNNGFRNQIRAVLDSCTNKQNALQAAEDAKSKKKTIWMVIGGFLLAALTFVGNQVFQHFKNIRRNKSMEEMMNRARADAERRAKGMVRGKINREVYDLKRKGRDAIRNTAKDALKGNNTKKTSIKI